MNRVSGKKAQKTTGNLAWPPARLVVPLTHVSNLRNLVMTETRDTWSELVSKAGPSTLVPSAIQQANGEKAA